MVTGLKPGQEYAYRNKLPAGSEEEAVVGTFMTVPTTSTQPLSFVFGACLGGQNYCRPAGTGWTIFNVMANQDPDFFMLMGDSVYVDTACNVTAESVPYISEPGAEGPYSDLDGFRTRYRYHLEDDNYAAFLHNTPVYVTWDDHEVLNDFGGQALAQVNEERLQDGIKAFFEYWPVMGTPEDYQLYRKVSRGPLADMFILDTRSYRDPNVAWDPNPDTLETKTMLGAEQYEWLTRALAESEATWKFIVTSVPLSYGTGFPQPEVFGYDGWANMAGRSGFESELMSLLFFIEKHNVQNVVFLAGDTHWPYAISYDPDRDGEANFYEFGSSPMSALPLAPPETPDLTFNPNVLYQEGTFAGDLFNFGHVAVDEAGNLTFRVVDAQGAERYSVTVQPE
jgi:alkaline phosphatase D